MRYLIILVLQILQLNLSLGIPFKPDKNGHDRHPKKIVNNPGLGFNYVGKDVLPLDSQLVGTRKYNSKDNVNGEKIVHTDRNVIKTKVSDFSNSGSYNAIISIPIFHDLESLLESLKQYKEDISVSKLPSKNSEKDEFSRFVRSDGSDSDSHKSVQNEDSLFGLSNDCDDECERSLFLTRDAANLINQQITPFPRNPNTAFPETHSQGLTPVSLPTFSNSNTQLNSNLKQITGNSNQGRAVVNLSTALPSSALLNPSLKFQNDTINQGQVLGSLSTSLSPNALPNPNLGQIPGAIDQRVAIERLLTILSPDLLPNIVIPTDPAKQTEILTSLAKFLPPDVLPKPSLQVPTDAGTRGRTLESLTRMLPSTALPNPNVVPSTVASKQGGELRNLSTVSTADAPPKQETAPSNLLTTLSPTVPQNTNLRLSSVSSNQRAVSDRFSTILQPTVPTILQDPSLTPSTIITNQRVSPVSFSPTVPPSVPQNLRLRISNKPANIGDVVKSLPTIEAPGQLPNLSLGLSASLANQGGTTKSLFSSLTPGTLPNPNFKLSPGVSNQGITLGSLSTSSPPGAQPIPNIQLSAGIINQRGGLESLPAISSPNNLPNPVNQTRKGKPGETLASLLTILSPEAPPKTTLNPPVNDLIQLKTLDTLSSIVPPNAQQNLELNSVNSEQIGTLRSVSTQFPTNIRPGQIFRLPTVPSKQGKTLESLSSILSPGAPPKPNLAVLNNVKSTSLQLGAPPKPNLAVLNNVNKNVFPVNNVGVTPVSLAGGVNIQPEFPSVQEMQAAEELVTMLRTVTSQNSRGIVSINPILNNTQSTVPSTPMIQIPVMCNTAMCSALVPLKDVQPGGALGKAISSGVNAGTSPTDVQSLVPPTVEEAVHYLIAVTCNEGVCTANRISSSRPATVPT